MVCLNGKQIIQASSKLHILFVKERVTRRTLLYASVTSGNDNDADGSLRQPEEPVSQMVSNEQMSVCLIIFLSLSSALTSIWRTRSLVTPKDFPIDSSVWGSSPPKPNPGLTLGLSLFVGIS